MSVDASMIANIVAFAYDPPSYFPNGTPSIRVVDPSYDDTISIFHDTSSGWESRDRVRFREGEDGWAMAVCK